MTSKREDAIISHKVNKYIWSANRLLVEEERNKFIRLLKETHDFINTEDIELSEAIALNYDLVIFRANKAFADWLEQVFREYYNNPDITLERMLELVREKIKELRSEEK